MLQGYGRCPDWADGGQWQDEGQVEFEEVLKRGREEKMRNWKNQAGEQTGMKYLSGKEGPVRLDWMRGQSWKELQSGDGG